uniref:Reverse transcriptase domain-containing protein n=1 Tax=Xenopus tropicalis TaxID=8364 RepID=A0A803K7H0_XENTR
MKLKFVSHNAKGLNTPVKRRMAGQYFHKIQADIVALQETHWCDKGPPPYIHRYYQQIYATTYHTKSRGVAIAFRPHVQFILTNSVIDTESRYILINGTIMGNPVTFLNLYAPPTGAKQFFTKVFELLTLHAQGTIVVMGDFNLVLDPRLDRSQHTTNPISIPPKFLKQLLQETSLIDIWRILHPGDIDYTFYSPVHNSYSRIDLILISQWQLPNVKDASILNITWSDHAPTTLTLQLTHTPQPMYSWRLNESLLSDPTITTSITDDLQEYWLINLDEELSMGTIWAAHKTVIRGSFIRLASHKKKQRTETIVKLEKELRDLEAKHKISTEPNISQKLTETRSELQKLLVNKAEKAIRWSKHKLFRLKDKPNQLLSQKLRKAQGFKQISHINNSKGVKLVNPEDIIQEFHNFYSSLYDSPSLTSREKRDAFLETIPLPKLTQNERSLLNNPITEEEVITAIKTLKSSSSPGPDGLPASYYKKFKEFLTPHLTTLFNDMMQGHSLPTDMLQANLSLLPKPNKDTTNIQNYRPISVLNVDIKLFSKILGSRLNKLMPKLIHPDQSGFILGRQTTDAIRRLLNIIADTNTSKSPILVLMLDVYKAFDSVTWPYLFNVLPRFNISGAFLEGLRVIYNNPTANIRLFHKPSPPIQIKRGTRQGCPLSPLLFALAMEPLAQLIRTNTDISGYTKGSKEYKISLYADDICMTLTKPLTGLPNLFQTLDRFHRISGLKVNISKTEALPINIPTSQKKLLELNFPFQWKQKTIAYLGVNITKTYESLYAANYPSILKKLRGRLADWTRLQISLFGRIATIHMIILPKLLYLFRALPTPIYAKEIHTFQREVMNFIWNSKRHRINKDTLFRAYTQGGQNVPHFLTYYRAARLTQLAQWQAAPNTIPLVDFENTSISPLQTSALLWATTRNTQHHHISNPIVTHHLKIWTLLKPKILTHQRNSNLQPLVGNPDFIPGLNAKDFLWWTQNNFHKLADLITPRGLKTLDYLKENNNIPPSEHYRYAQIHHFYLSQKSIRPTMEMSGFELRCKTPTHLSGLITQIYRHLRTEPPNNMCKYMREWNADLPTPLPPQKWAQIWQSAKKISPNISVKETTYKLLARWYVTPALKNKFNPESSSLCFRGCKAQGNYYHSWWLCPIVEKFWSQTFQLISQVLQTEVTIDQELALFSLPTTNLTKTQNKLTIQFIAAARWVIALNWLAPHLSISQLKSRIEYIQTMHYLTATLSDSLEQHHELWEPWTTFKTLSIRQSTE